ncbi:MAG: hypothetical protein OXG78_01960 [Chloroflexi bacterium]|nr:hypothetical protein [Chloroflexota bacterium]
MLSISGFQTLRQAYSAHDDLTLGEALERIGRPSVETLVDSAVSHMSSRDRNVRVLMLRVLRHQQGELAMPGVLAGLHDETRRVCAVAIQACPNYLAYPQIVARLEEIALDARLKRKLRRRALSMLTGNEGRWQGDLTPPVFAALKRLMLVEEHRFTILFGLARLDSTPRITMLLEEFARSDDVRERDIARRALDGERVIHIDAYTSDPALHRQITQTREIAHGRMYYWLPRAGWPLRSMPSV